MKWHKIGSQALVALGALIAAIGTAPAAEAPAGGRIARVESVSPGGREFTVIDRQGAHIQVVLPARPPQAAAFARDGDLVNPSALREGDTVLLTGIGHDNWFEARRVEVLTGARVGGATAAERVLRFTGFAGGRELRAVSADGTEYRILFPSRPQAISLWKAGNLVELSALREGDRLVAQGNVQDHVIRADRLEVLDESRLGRGAAVPFRLTYRGTAGWRRLIGEAPDGTRYTVVLPRRPQALYFTRGGALVEPSALQPGESIEVRGVIDGNEIEADRIVLR
jgi:hypothetical protein